LGIPGSFGQHLSEETIRSLALAQVGGADAARTESVPQEYSLKADAGSLVSDLRRGGGSAGIVDAGADDDLVEALLASISDFDRAIENEILSGLDIATSLLTGLRLRADLLPQTGSRVAAVVTLLAGEEENEQIAQPDGRDLEVPLKDFLINLLRDPIDSSVPHKTNTRVPIGEEGKMGEPAGGQLAVSVAIGLATAPLYLGAARATEQFVARRPVQAARR
jgi:hypothetical protein